MQADCASFVPSKAMQDPDPVLSQLRDPRIAAHAVATAPAWLWRDDGTSILWANPTGAAIFGASCPATLAARHFASDHPAAAQIARLAPMLPLDARPRLERLRGFGGSFGRALTCACSHITLSDTSRAVLIVAIEAAGPALPLAERARRLLAECAQPAALFSADGTLLHASPAALERLGEATTLDVLGINALAGDALAAGHAAGTTPSGAATIIRLGAGPGAVMLVTFGALQADAEITPADAPAPPPPAKPALPATARRHPLRFVWRTDTDGHFTVESDEFSAMIGPHTAAAFGRPWHDIARELDLDPAHEVARALSSRETWSNVTVAWPVDGSGERLAVELAGLPVFDRNRTFTGYRGFGICRDLARMAELMRTRLAAAETDTPSSAPAKVVPFSASGPSAEPTSPTLSPGEQRAFRELARQLTERLSAVGGPAREPLPSDDHRGAALAGKPTPGAPAAGNAPNALDGFPFGVLAYRPEALLYANRAFLAWTGHDSLTALAEAGGLDNFLIEPGTTAAGDAFGGKTFVISARGGGQAPVEARLFDVAWDGELAHMLTLVSTFVDRSKPSEPAQRRAETEAHELRSILDTATDGVIVIAHDGRIVSCNRSAEALFGWVSGELAGHPLADLFAPESQRVAADYLDGLQRAGVASVLNDGREVIGRVRQGGLIPLFMTMGRIADDTQKFCAVFRDITQWKKAEEELINARRLAEKASLAKSDFLAKISHEIRTPLNAIIGFSEVMMSERFGPVGNERYREYLKDIHTSGTHLLSLINDLLDLSKIEAGKLDLTFTSVNLNELTQQCVAIMQPQANRERIIIRTSIAPALPKVVADARSVRQIVLNLLSNSIKFTGAGGQVIVSTALSDAGEAVLRVRDTGIGMSEKDITTALEPFRQLATSGPWGSGGTGLGLPLTKALAEANRASFSITSAPNAGTLVEISFPATRVLAE
jgi:PAS domain S-box-containing protein